MSGGFRRGPRGSKEKVSVSLKRALRGFKDFTKAFGGYREIPRGF